MKRHYLRVSKVVRNLGLECSWYKLSVSRSLSILSGRRVSWGWKRPKPTRMYISESRGRNRRKRVVFQGLGQRSPREDSSAPAAGQPGPTVPAFHNSHLLSEAFPLQMLRRCSEWVAPAQRACLWAFVRCHGCSHSALV